MAPAPIDDVRDTTGAGDVFAGTFIAHWAAGAAPAAACAAGHRAAAATLGTAGAPTGGPHRGGRTVTHPDLSVDAEVADALAPGMRVVAMESTIYSSLGLPAPANAEALARCSAAIRDAGAVPAMVAVLGGRWQVGVTGDDVERVLATDRKVAERDLAVVTASGGDGVTTVSATLAVAHAAGIRVFATGGIGGVHRQSEVSGDVSADLGAIARHPVVTTCAGAKAFLDLPRTVELLDTLGVPLLGWRHDWFPAFYTRSSGVPVQHRVESAAEVAAIFRHRPDPSRASC